MFVVVVVAICDVLSFEAALCALVPPFVFAFELAHAPGTHTLADANVLSSASTPLTELAALLGVSAVPADAA